jgi:hypothetical protein
MRKFLTGAVAAALVLCCSSAFAGQTWTDGDGDGLPDGGPFLLGSPGAVNVDVWIDSQSFLWTNYLVFVEWNDACLDYVSAAYIVSGGTNFPLDDFSNPSAIGFGGFGFSLQGVTRIGSVSLNYTGPGTCCVQPIIDYNNPYGTYCALGNGPAYLLFTTNSQTCWRTDQGPQPEACCFPNGSCADLLPPDCVAQGGTPQGVGTNCATVTCPQPTEACCFPGGGCQDLPAQVCVGQGGAPQGPGTSCATTSCPQPTVACCFPDGSCLDLTTADCAAQGGTPFGPSCAGVICPQPTVACCFADGSCADLTAADCAAAGGVVSGADCATTVCEQPERRGACCFSDGSCQDGLTADECGAAGGSYEGDNTLCSQTECPTISTESKSWGEIKGLYR